MNQYDAVKELRAERDALIRRVKRLLKALDSASRVAYSKGYIQGVQDALLDEPTAKAEAEAVASRVCQLSEASCKAADCAEHGWLR